MCYIPKLARELQSFNSVEELNHHMDLHYGVLRNILTKSNDAVFYLLKKYACKVAGVCWLKQDSLASLAGVSTKTVERTIKLLKDHGVIKIFHTKRSNGLNGNCYYVLQPFSGEALVDDEEIVQIEEAENVGAGEVPEIIENTGEVTPEKKDKLFLNSQTPKNFEEENNIKACARVTKNSLNNSEIENHYKPVIDHLVENHFSEKAAKNIVGQAINILQVEPFKLLKACSKAIMKLHKRLSYPEPIFSMSAYFLSLIQDEVQPGFSKRKAKNINKSSKPESPVFYNWLEQF
ncbi:helix-turn-helix domain-containing protein [Cytobacillus sp. Bac17]|uniref:helix-turn-helix domain-containing protein n=1 Tax=Cytobacillus sp. Bac17 TaxID=2926008 RepID=UPI0021199825|nr:helix-turn-helix domain-containing protein [Cytobacillus sp. Bac17]